MNVFRDAELQRDHLRRVERARRHRTTITQAPANLIKGRNSHISYLCEHMRDDEIEQYLAFTGNKTFDPEVAAAGLINTGGLKFTILGPDGYPAATGGYHPTLPGICQSWMVGSNEGWRTSWRSITQGCRWLADGLFAGGSTHRLQTNALASRAAALEWFERGLGMTREGTMRRATPDGRDVALFARLAGD